MLSTIRSLLCTATNCTPHERMFNYNRRSTNGESLPSWLTTPGKVHMKRHVCHSKYEPLVEEVDLLEANPMYAFIRNADGRESTVSLRDLPPVGAPIEDEFIGVNTQSHNTDNAEFVPPEKMVDHDIQIETTPAVEVITDTPSVNTGEVVNNNPSVRRSARLKKAPTLLDL